MNIFKLFTISLLLSSAAMHQTTYTMARTKAAPKQSKLVRAAKWVLITTALFAQQVTGQTSKPCTTYENLNSKPEFIEAHPCRMPLQMDCFRELVPVMFEGWSKEYCIGSKICSGIVNHRCNFKVAMALEDQFNENQKTEVCFCDKTAKWKVKSSFLSCDETGNYTRIEPYRPGQPRQGLIHLPLPKCCASFVNALWVP